MALFDRESRAAVLQEDADARHDQSRSESREVGLDQRDPGAVTVDGAHVDRSPGVEGTAEFRRDVEIDSSPSGRESFRRDERLAVGVLVQHLDAVERGLAGGLDQQVGPEFVFGIGG